METEDREDTIVCLGEEKVAPAVLDVGADREDARHAVRRRVLDRGVRVVERREVRVRVDHVTRQAIHTCPRPPSARRAAASSVAHLENLLTSPASILSL